MILFNNIHEELNLLNMNNYYNLCNIIPLSNINFHYIPMYHYVNIIHILYISYFHLNNILYTNYINQNINYLKYIKKHWNYSSINKYQVN